MKCTNLIVVEAFYRKYEKDYESGTMYTTHGKLYSYSTCIAEWKDNTLLINETSYSCTTSKHLSLLYRFIKESTKTYHLYNVPKNVIRLSHLVKSK